MQQVTRLLWEVLHVAHLGEGLWLLGRGPQSLHKIGLCPHTLTVQVV